MTFEADSMIDLLLRLRCSVVFRWGMTFLIGGLCSRVFDYVKGCGEPPKPVKNISRPQVVLDIVTDVPDEECPICLDSLCVEVEQKALNTVARLPCGHAFHRHCITRWLVRCSSCPVCRMDAVRSEKKTS
jgi:hypothetical protein